INFNRQNWVITPPSCPAQSKIASGHLMFREVQSVEGEILRLFALEPGTTQGQLAKMLNANVYSRSQILANLNV
ncbi:MAG TPA: hypothetical protein DCZ91_20835, partial [Lachnospiraceae bacterium]|nr:hypothetical protein [Lachnospiraceae bacterium]